MEQNGDFKYFTGQETMQFAFIPVPMALLSDPRYENLSSDAKLLYALLLNRMNLSRKNGWFDEENRVFIYYSIEDIAADLHCGRNKAIKALQELDTEKPGRFGNPIHFGPGPSLSRRPGIPRMRRAYCRQFVF